jgi:hypothetical protein
MPQRGNSLKKGFAYKKGKSEAWELGRGLGKLSELLLV